MPLLHTLAQDQNRKVRFTVGSTAEQWQIQTPQLCLYLNLARMHEYHLIAPTNMTEISSSLVEQVYVMLPHAVLHVNSAHARLSLSLLLRLHSPSPSRLWSDPILSSPLISHIFCKRLTQFSLCLLKRWKNAWAKNWQRKMKFKMLMYGKRMHAISGLLKDYGVSFSAAGKQVH